MRYKLGDKVYWIESGTNYGKTIPCPVCFGKRFVTVILGDDSQVKTECGYCSHGYDRPSGSAKVWEPNAILKNGTITGVSCKDGIRYEVGYTSLYEYELYDNESIAEEARKIRLEEEIKRAEVWFKESFVNCTKKQAWSAGYHRNQIKSAERNIEWHQARLCMINPQEVKCEKS